jgi:general secretion pathway protein A
MYKDFFGLEKLPFNLTPDPAFLFLPPKHREALTGLTYAVMERKGFVVLSGEAGTGKTTLINSVLSHLPADRVETSIILNPTLTAPEFLEGVLLDFDITDLHASKAQRLWKFQEFLARTHRENRYAVLVIDEAHKLSTEVLEEIRLLGNYESASEKFLQILLLGQTEIDELLERRELRQFKQRIALRLSIEPLTPPEIREYLCFRWGKAGARQPLPFSADSVEGIVKWSQGIPRQVNSICDSALLMAFAEGSARVLLEHVREAASNLGLARPAAIVPPVDDVPQLPVASVAEDRELAMPTLERYGYSRGNSSLLGRLSEKFRFH